jgi:hypothetical protein
MGQHHEQDHQSMRALLLLFALLPALALSAEGDIPIVQSDGTIQTKTVSGDISIAADGSVTASTGTDAGDIVQLDGSGRLPAVDGSQLTGLSSAPVASVAGRTGDVTLSTADISGLGTAATTAATDYATAAEGTLAASAMQPADDAADLGSGSADDGQIPTADGSGGIDWEDALAGGGGHYFSLQNDGATTQSIPAATVTGVTTALGTEVSDSAGWVSGTVFFPQAAGCWILGGTAIGLVEGDQARVIVFIQHSTDGSVWDYSGSKAGVLWRASSSQGTAATGPLGGSGSFYVCANGTSDRWQLAFFQDSTTGAPKALPSSAVDAYVRFWGMQVPPY